MLALKMRDLDGHQWLTPAILVSQEASTRKITA
jgi:hypothetical protein